MIVERLDLVGVIAHHQEALKERTMSLNSTKRCPLFWLWLERVLGLLVGIRLETCVFAKSMTTQVGIAIINNE